MTGPTNRAALARERAGLTLRQAARLLDMEPEHLTEIEVLDSTFADADLERLADVYGVNVPWLAGDVERYDYAALKDMKGAEDLTFHDRDVIAEFIASMPRKTKETK